MESKALAFKRVMMHCPNNDFATEKHGKTRKYSVLSDVYTLTEAEESTSSPGEYNIWGTNRGGELIMAGYDPKYNDFSLLEMTASVNRYFSFTFSSKLSCSLFFNSLFTACQPKMKNEK